MSTKNILVKAMIDPKTGFMPFESFKAPVGGSGATTLSTRYKAEDVKFKDNFQAISILTYNFIVRNPTKVPFWMLSNEGEDLMQKLNIVFKPTSEIVFQAVITSESSSPIVGVLAFTSIDDLKIVIAPGCENSGIFSSTKKLISIVLDHKRFKAFSEYNDSYTLVAQSHNEYFINTNNHQYINCNNITADSKMYFGIYHESDRYKLHRCLLENNTRDSLGTMNPFEDRIGSAARRKSKELNSKYTDNIMSSVSKEDIDFMDVLTNPKKQMHTLCDQATLDFLALLN